MAKCLCLNAELIRYVESRPDTYVTLVSGERMLVRETMDDVMQRAVQYQQSKLLLPRRARPAARLPPPPTNRGSRQTWMLPRSSA